MTSREQSPSEIVAESVPSCLLDSKSRAACTRTEGVRFLLGTKLHVAPWRSSIRAHMVARVSSNTSDAEENRELVNPVAECDRVLQLLHNEYQLPGVWFLC